MNASPRRSLQGKVALVTGASSGIGRAAALELARRGAKVVASARRAPELEGVVEDIRSAGGIALSVVADINVEQDVVDLVGEVVSTFGRLDIAFNNAGTEGQFTPFEEQSNAVYDAVFNANVRGVFWSMQQEAKAMFATGGGSIINNASMAGVIGFANAAVYVASKHAVLGLTKTASIEWFHRGLRVNAVNPGIIDTPLQDRVWSSSEAKRSFAVSTVPGRAGAPEEVAKAVAFLASEDASFVSGHGLLIDGGYSVA